MKFCCVFTFAAVAAFAFAVEYCSAYGDPYGLSCLGYYGAYAPPVIPAPLPPPVPVPPPVPAPPVPVPPKLDPCGCHPSCLHLLKPCLQAKLLHLKKNLLEKKLAALLAHCTHYKKSVAC